jgi:DNA adenine methylase
MLNSPLRYPGGKGKMFPYFVEVVKANNLYSCTYCEPYAGGAGLALKLLSSGFVERVALNDIDPSIFAFWHSAVNAADQLCGMIEDTAVTIDEWRRQKAVWQTGDLANPVELGFAAFFLNRTNRSGIIDGAGPIGGYSQDGPWKLDVRLNKAPLIESIQRIRAFRQQISVTMLDAIQFASQRFAERDTLCYLDPPYYVKGSKLYRNFYRHDDHCEILDLLVRHRDARWVVSYDDVSQIRKIYAEFEPISYSLSYSAGTKGTGREVIYFSDALTPPDVVGFDRQLAA